MSTQTRRKNHYRIKITSYKLLNIYSITIKILIKGKEKNDEYE